MTRGARLVICSLGPSEPAMLPASNIDADRPFISGGERSLYELAVAASCLGMDVELRGDLNRKILAEVTDAAGSAPEVNLEPRRPDPTDVVVIPEAHYREILTGPGLSGATWVMYHLAPPGLWAWSFLPDWVQPDAHQAPLGTIGKAQSFRAIRDCGFHQWTNAHGIAATGKAAGVDVEWLGTGTPVQFPPPQPKSFDLAVVENNRWAGWANTIASRLDGYSVLRIKATGSVYSLCEQLASARILVWPSRVEGMSRIAREARAVGTVPVALNTNPFATLDDHGGGVVLVDDLDQIEREARILLEDPRRLAELSQTAVQSVRTQTDWPSFMARLARAMGALERKPVPAGSDARQVMGDHLGRAWGELVQRATGLTQEIAEARRELEEVQAQLVAAETRLFETSARLGESTDRINRLQVELGHARRTIEEMTETSEDLTDLVGAYQRRLVLRVVDSTRLGPVWTRLRRRL